MIKIISYKHLDKGALQGSACCEIVKWHLQINDIAIFQSGGRRWITLPSRKIEREGEKIAYFPHIRWTDRDIDNRFQATFFAALDEWKAQNPEIANPYAGAPPANPEHNEGLPF